MEYFELNNGIKVPALGFGTYQISKRNTEENVSQALNLGYRSIDTAQNYGNESEVGSAVNKSGIQREKIFITSKTQTSGYKNTKARIDASLQAAKLDYFDLMIIHWPNGNDIETYHALEDAYKEGKLRAIGLSNFNSEQTQQIIDHATVMPAVNQIETHIYWQQKKMHQFLNAKNILHESWAPLGEGATDILKNPTLQKIASSHKKSIAQVILRFLTQSGIMVIPKSTNVDHIESNLDIFDFKLTESELLSIQQLDQKHSASGWPSTMRTEANY